MTTERLTPREVPEAEKLLLKLQNTDLLPELKAAIQRETDTEALLDTQGTLWTLVRTLDGDIEHHRQANDTTIDHVDSAATDAHSSHLLRSLKERLFPTDKTEKRPNRDRRSSEAQQRYRKVIRTELVTLHKFATARLEERNPFFKSTSPFRTLPDPPSQDPHRPPPRTH